ncbi:MAG TPA: tetratricopeptide repeat protein [Pseudomonadota bacterium]|nr:tetratricopeptide repeat protein [Pseudomonadota bacterium]
MRLALNVPSPWVSAPSQGNQRVALLPGEQQPLASLRYGPLILRPDEPQAWIEASARRDTPPGSRVRLGQAAEIETETGWALHLVEAEVSGPQGEPVESRLLAFYAFLEHAAVAIVSIPDRSHIAGLRDSLLAVLRSARPDWRAEPVCLAEAWDLQPQSASTSLPTSPAAPPPHPAVPDQPQDPTATAPPLPAETAAPLADAHQPLANREPAAALLALEQVQAQAGPSAATHYQRGLALSALGRPSEAIAAWQATLQLQPTHRDATYRLALAHFQSGDYAQALSGLQRALQLAPSDLLCQQRLIQSLYALGRPDEGEAARERFRHSLQSSRDPRARFIEEYVFDQLSGPGFVVQVSETVRPRDPTFYALLRFAAYDSTGKPLPASVVIETSDHAKQAGTPFVLALQTGAQFRVLGSAKTLPPYAALTQKALELLTQALKPSPPSSAPR